MDAVAALLLQHSCSTDLLAASASWIDARTRVCTVTALLPTACTRTRVHAVDSTYSSRARLLYVLLPATCLYVRTDM